MKTLVVGISAVALENYLPFLSRQPDIELLITNRTPAKATEAAKRFGGHAVARLQDAGAVDCAFVLTTEVPRYDIVRDLIELGVPRIFCEKPFVARDGQQVNREDFERGAELLTAAHQSGVELAQQFNYRFMAPVRLAQDLAAERELGAVINLAATSHYGCWCHVIDLVNLFTGGVDEVLAVEGAQLLSEHGVIGRDLAVAIRSHSGVVGTLLGTAGTSWERPLFGFRLNYESGSISFGDFGDAIELSDYRKEIDERISLPRALSRWDQYRQSFVVALETYLASIRNHQTPPVTGADGVEELRLEAAIRLSADQGRPVSLISELPL